MIQTRLFRMGVLAAATPLPRSRVVRASHFTDQTIVDAPLRMSHFKCPVFYARNPRIYRGKYYATAYTPTPITGLKRASMFTLNQYRAEPWTPPPITGLTRYSHFVDNEYGAAAP